MAAVNLRSSAKQATILGSSYAIAMFVDADGDPVTVGEKYFTFPYFENSSNVDNVSEESQVNEGGDTWGAISSKDFQYNVTLAQQDRATSMLSKDLAGKYLRIIKEKNVQPIDGKYQYLVMPITEISENRTMEAKGGLYQYTFRLLPVEVDNLTIDLSAIVMETGGATGFQVPIADFTSATDKHLFKVGEYYEIIEVDPS